MRQKLSDLRALEADGTVGVGVISVDIDRNTKCEGIQSRLGSTAATLKLKGIDGVSHKRWTMWLNSTTSEEPYQGLTG
jgi:hypothetical protein